MGQKYPISAYPIRRCKELISRRTRVFRHDPIHDKRVLIEIIITPHAMKQSDTTPYFSEVDQINTENSTTGGNNGN
jgi:hypothetical protein